MHDIQMMKMTWMEFIRKMTNPDLEQLHLEEID